MSQCIYVLDPGIYWSRSESTGLQPPWQGVALPHSVLNPENPAAGQLKASEGSAKTKIVRLDT